MGLGSNREAIIGYEGSDGGNGKKDVLTVQEEVKPRRRREEVKYQ